MNKNDDSVTYAMKEALRLAVEAAKAGEVPVGAVVLDGDGNIIGRGANLREGMHDPLAHAEVLAMKSAASSRKSWNLSDCTLVVTLEPCPMCAGAILQTRLRRVIFGAWDAKLGACGSVWDILRDPHVGSYPEVIGSVCESECAQVLRNFFENHR
ncbi:putative cytidine and deoxycytidylate deaminase [Gardnerella vaginalis 1500E]|uniref:tRNA-specific adenosine deaminase n=2 Tax=Gardnerella TaxID=2701 RepID=I4M4V0_GARVA|nr:MULTISPECIES: nucleoside deaminase [Gardnerella]EIK84240.1 putative cytidine and deoxycytidylate deaminase [Gardnerella vaginalis 1500E]MDF0753921.1 nucleoside deaminase [Gardnerella greenwoodii]PMC43524.1 nucleoside deaminase [Gardnerella greenwoodii]